MSRIYSAVLNAACIDAQRYITRIAFPNSGCIYLVSDNVSSLAGQTDRTAIVSTLYARSYSSSSNIALGGHDNWPAIAFNFARSIYIS
jgi:hypothetical protein